MTMSIQDVCARLGAANLRLCLPGAPTGHGSSEQAWLGSGAVSTPAQHWQSGSKHSTEQAEGAGHHAISRAWPSRKQDVSSARARARLDSDRRLTCNLV